MTNLESILDTLKEILSLLRDKEDYTLTTEENNQIAVNISNAQKKNQTNKKHLRVYKVRVYDAAKVFVGWLRDNGEVELVKPSKDVKDIARSPYYPQWYIENDSNSNCVLDYTTIIPKNKIENVYITNDIGCYKDAVLGYLDSNAKVIFYDQFIS